MDGRDHWRRSGWDVPQQLMERCIEVQLGRGGRTGTMRRDSRCLPPGEDFIGWGEPRQWAALQLGYGNAGQGREPRRRDRRRCPEPVPFAGEGPQERRRTSGGLQGGAGRNDRLRGQLLLEKEIAD
jgi:hypothetical protein